MCHNGRGSASRPSPRWMVPAGALRGKMRRRHFLGCHCKALGTVAMRTPDSSACLALATAVSAALMAPAALAERIARDPAQVRAFRADHPCPATGRTRGACPGYQVDHPRPLCAGGLDRPENMQWLRTEDHAFKTVVDVRECRKLRASAAQPASDQRRNTGPHAATASTYL